MIALASPMLRPLEVTPHGAFGVPRPARAGTHYGLDFIAAEGDLVVASTAGVVARVGFDAPVDEGGGGGGQFVIVRSGDYEIGYMHLSATLVQKGERVAVGDTLGRAGRSGTETSGAHLHFQVNAIDAAGRKTPIDPAPYLRLVRSPARSSSSSSSSGLGSLVSALVLGLAVDVALGTERGRRIKRWFR